MLNVAFQWCRRARGRSTTSFTSLTMVSVKMVRLYSQRAHGSTLSPSQSYVWHESSSGIVRTCDCDWPWRGPPIVHF